MVEFPLVLAAGLLGSSHCVGMCGPFALAIGAGGGSARGKLARQLVYSAGRLFTYAALGAVAGYCGLRIASLTPSLVQLPALLSIGAGSFLLYQGLKSVGLIRSKPVVGGTTKCLAGSAFSTFLTAGQLRGAFLAGMFTGLLPCGLLYGILGLAASSQDMKAGALIMATFGAGTIPVMVVTGLSGALLSLAARRNLLRVAAWCVVLTGVITIARGVGFLPLWHTSTACPLCK